MPLADDLSTTASPPASEVDALLDDVPVAVTRVREGICLWGNRRLTELLGWHPEALRGQECRRLFIDDASWEEFRATAATALREGPRCTIEHPFRHRDGRAVLVRAHGRRSSPGGDVLWFLEDVTALRAAERAQAAAQGALRESEERVRAVLAALDVGVVLHDASGRIVLGNAAAERILGLTRAQLEGRDSLDPRWRATHDDGSPFPGETHPSMVTLRTGEPRSGVMMGIELPDGIRRWISVSSEPLRGRPGEPPRGVVATFTDVSELRRERELLRQREAKLERVIRGSNDGYFEWDPRSDRVERSPRVTRMLGLSPESLQPTREAWLERVHPEDAPRVRAALDEAAFGDSGGFEREYRVRAADGTWRTLLARARRSEEASSGGRLLITGTITDITELRRNQSLMAEAERARLVGQLAGGIAHDYNNLLTTIIATSEFLGEALPPGSQQARDLASIVGAAERAAELTHQLLSYGRRQVLLRSDVDAGELVRGLLPLVTRVCGEATEVRLRIAQPPPVLSADRRAVEQALLNLVLNAHEAMPGGGRLAIAVDRVELHEGDPALGLHAAAGAFVRLSVTDSGTGIRAEHLPHIFEPFFSTKEPAAGAGLGLASVDGAMAQLGGAVTVETELRKGTTVTLYVPAA